MKGDQVALADARRRAFALLSMPFFVNQEFVNPSYDEVGNITGGDWKPVTRRNGYYVRKENISSPAALVQEKAYTVANGQEFFFDYTVNAPNAQNNLVGGVAFSNNVNLGNNNIASIYAIKLLQREGVAGSTTIYRSRGITPIDDAIYNSIVSLKLETSTLIDQLPGQDFRDSYATIGEFDANSGLVLIDPQRILTGKLGVFRLSFNIIQSIAGLVLSPNVFLSARLYFALGQAQAVK